MFDDPDEFRPLPHPMDRTWVHPSELGPNLQPTPPPTRARHASWRIGALGAGIVVAVSGVAVAALKTDAIVGGRTRIGPASASVALVGAADDRGVVTINARRADAADPTRGSGISVGDGTVVTSAALLETATEVRVGDAPATVVARDAETDIAVLHTNTALTPALLASTVNPQAGERLALLSGAANADGTIRTTNVTFTAGAPDGTATPRVVAGLVATDIPATTAAAGSAVADRSGAIVGLVSGLRAPGTGVLVIPIDVVRDVVDQVRRTGTVRHGWLGVTVSDTTDGPTVIALAANGPAERADLRRNDRILSIDGSATLSAAAILAAVRSTAPGATVQVRVSRDGRIRTVAVVTAAAPTTA